MKFLKKTDIIIISILILVSLLAFVIYKLAFADKPAKAEIYFKSQLVETIELSGGEDRIFSIPQKQNVTLHLNEEGSINFEHSDCPDKVCINAGKLRTVGESAACLPNEIIIKIVSSGKNNDSDLDFIVGK